MNDVMLSVIIPTFNEENRIRTSLEKILGFLKRQPYRSEIILSDDGSRDRTLEMARPLLSEFPHQILEVSQNQGKGSAVRRGMLVGRGKFLVFTDADLSTPIEEVTGFLHHWESGYDVVIGSRALAASKIEIRQNFLREGMGRVFNRLACLFAFHGIADSQCGFKAFTQAAAADLFRRQKLSGFSFDAEILYLAQYRGMRILEKPVVWRNSHQSRVRILSDPFRMFWDLVKIRWLHRKEKAEP